MNHLNLSGWQPADYNPRRISPEAAAALRESISTFGDLSGIVVNAATGFVICGHQRRDALASLDLGAIAWGEEFQVELGPPGARFLSSERHGLASLPGGARVAVRQVHWPIDFERAANVTANNPNVMGEFTAGLADVLASIEAAFPAMMSGLRLDDIVVPASDDDPNGQPTSGDSQSTEDEAGDGEEDEDAADTILARREFFKSTNAYDLPELLPHMLADTIPTSTWCSADVPNGHGLMFLWGTNKLPSDVSGGTLAFYVDDKRFASIWRRAEETVAKLLSLNFATVVMPDFSMWRNWPLAWNLFKLYQARWCARYWQENGIRVAPSLNWADERTHAFAFVGIPKRAPVVFCQCRTTRDEPGRRLFLSGLTAGIRALEPQNLVLYGGPLHRAWIEPELPEGPAYHWLDSWTAVRNKERRLP